MTPSRLRACARSFAPAVARLAAVACLTVVGSATASAQLDDLTKYIPSDANVLVVVDVDRLLDSEYAQNNNWQRSLEKAFADGLTMIPPDSHYYIVSSKMDFEVMESMWTVALAHLTQSVPVSQIAERRFGTVDTVAGKQVAVLPDDRIIANLSPGYYAAFAPGNRQQTARWLKAGDTARGPQLTPFLQETMEQAKSEGTPIVMAMDLQYLLPEQFVRERLDASGTMDKPANKDVDLDELAGVLASIRGVKFVVDLGEKLTGSVIVEFDRECEMMRGYAKFLLLEALSNQGAYIEDFQSWRAEARGNTLTLSGGLTSSTMRRVFSLIDQPVAVSSAASAATDTGADPNKQKVVQKTKQYFDSVDTLLRDLRSHKGTAKSMGQIGLWFDKYADKIQRLPILNVDPEMLDFGEYVAAQLRNASMGIKQGNINTGARSAQVWNSGDTNYYGGYGYNYYGYGGYQYRGGTATFNYGDMQVQRQRNAIRAEEKAKSSQNMRQVIDDIKSVEAEVRRKMTEKYQVEF